MSRERRFVGWVERAVFAAKTFLLRRAFFQGRASFVKADIEGATDAAEGGRLLTHFRVTTGPLHSGTAGWTEFVVHSRLGRTADLSAVLLCRFCRHRYVVAVTRAGDPLSLPAAPGGGAGFPAAFEAQWFRFFHPDCRGPAFLACPRCERDCEPSVRHLA